MYINTSNINLIIGMIVLAINNVILSVSSLVFLAIFGDGSIPMGIVTIIVTFLITGYMWAIWILSIVQMIKYKL